jgi:hypothetical protein
MNTFQRVPGVAVCDTYIDEEGMTCQRWRPATAAEAARLASPEGNPNHAAYRPKLFGYDTDEFMARQHRVARKGGAA